MMATTCSRSSGSLKAGHDDRPRTKIPRIVISPCYELPGEFTEGNVGNVQMEDIDAKEHFQAWTKGRRCSECPLHCLNPIVKRPGFPYPKQNGLYQTIADLKAQIQQLQRLRSTEKDALLVHLAHLEEQKSAAQDKNSGLIAQNQWLENKVHFLSSLVVMQGPKYESKRSALDTDSTKISPSRRRPTLRRTKSQEAFGHRSLTGLQQREVNAPESDCKVICHMANGSSLFEATPLAGPKKMSTIEEVDEDNSWTKEKTRLLEVNRRLLSQVHHLEDRKNQLNAELHDAREQLELMEFRVLELEQCCVKCQDGTEGKQLENRCVGPDECWEEPWSLGSQVPDLTDGSDVEFQEEKITEIRSKILNIVRYHSSLMAKEKTILVQTAAALDVCQKRIRDYRNRRSQSSDEEILVKVETSPLSTVALNGVTRTLDFEKETSGHSRRKSVPCCVIDENVEVDDSLFANQSHATIMFPKSKGESFSDLDLVSSCDETEKRCSPSSAALPSWNSEQSPNDPLLMNAFTMMKVNLVDASTNTDYFFDTSPKFISEVVSNKIAKPLSNEMGEVEVGSGSSEKYECCDAWRPQPSGGGVALLDELEKLKCLLMEKHAEMRNKDIEYNLKLEALKCDKEEGQSQLEHRLAAMQERERRIQMDYEVIVNEKATLRQSLDQQMMDFDCQREELLKQLDEALHQVDRWKTAYHISEERQQQTMDVETVKELDVKICAKDAELEEMKQTEIRLRRIIDVMKSRWDILKTELESANMCREAASSYGVAEKEDDDDYWLGIVREMISSKSKLLIKIDQLEKKEAVYRETLDEADRIVAEAERSYQERLEEMEQSEAQLRRKIERLEQNETQLRQSLKASVSRQLPTCTEVKKVGELLERLTEAEATEVGLRQKLRQTEQRAADAEARATVVERELQEQEDLIRNLENLKRTERALKERIEELETSEDALRETLHSADSIMAAREQQLWEKIDALRTELDAYKLLDSSGQKNESRLIHGEDSKNVATGQTMDGEVNIAKMEHILRPSVLCPVIDIAKEQQNRNDLEAGLRTTYCCKHLKQIADCVKVCPRCLPICGAVLGDLQAHVERLNQVGFGCDSHSLLDDSLLTSGQINESHIEKLSMSGPLGNCDPGVEAIEESSDTRLSDRNGVKEKHQVIGSLHYEMESVVAQLAQKDRELKASQQEACQLTKFLHNCEEELHKRNTEMSSLALHVAHLQEENEGLKRKLWKMEMSQAQAKDRATQREEELESAKRHLTELESKLGVLNKQLRSSEHLQKEKDRLQDLCKMLEDDLKKTRDAEHRLCAENLHLHHKVEGLRERVSSLQLLKKDHKSLLTKYHVLEKKLSSTELTLESLQNQNTTLRRECWEKGEAISSLKQDVLSSKYHCDHPSYFGDLRALKCQSVSQSSDDSGIRDCLGTMTSLESETFEDHVLTDVRSHAKASQPSTPRTQDGVEQSMTFSTPGDDYFTNSDAESLKPRHKSGVLPKGYSTSRIPRYTGFGGKLTNDPQNHQPETVTSKDSSLKFYSNRNTVRPEGSVTKKAGSLIAWRQRRGSLSSSDDSVSPDATADSYSRSDPGQRVKSSKKPPTISKPENKKYSPNKSPAPKATMIVKSSSLSSKTAYTPGSGIPDAPSNFHVTRKVGQDGLLVAWNTPVMDTSGCSNGATVSGYQIFVNGELHQNVRSAHRTKALLNNVDLSLGHNVDISIQTLSLTGQQSAVVTTQYAEHSSDRAPTPPKSSKHIWEAAFQKVGFLKEEGRVALQTTDKGAMVSECFQGYQSGLYMV